MLEINSSHADLNLLRVFVILMREGSVTRAAQRLSVGQPAVSQALARLRQLLGDPLLVRDGRRMEPTERAKRLMSDIAPLISGLEGALRAGSTFSPSTASNIFSIGLPDDLQITLLPIVTQRLAGEAPRARLRVRQTSQVTAGAMLEAHDVDSVVGALGTLPANARTRKLMACPYRVLRGDDDPAPLDLDAYCNRGHVLITAAGDFRGSVDLALDTLRRARRVAFSLPLFGALAAVLPKTELLATVPLPVASALASFSGIRSETLPFTSPTFDVGMAWREAVDRDPAEMWFRTVLEESFKLASRQAGR